jgi:hypothetical protein
MLPSSPTMPLLNWYIGPGGAMKVP